MLANGRAAVAVLPTGGAEGARSSRHSWRAKACRPRVAITGTVRANITVAEPDGTVPK